MKIMQGDQYAIVFTGTKDGEALDLSQIELIEFTVGKLRKTYPGEVTTDEDGNFLFPLTQEETFQFKSAQQAVQIRVKFSGAEPVVIGVGLDGVRVSDSVSKVVL